MFSNERWRCFKIVEDNSSELIGAVKNALLRGSSPQQAAQSFINAGYPEPEVNEAFSHLQEIQSEIAQDKTKKPTTKTKKSNVKTFFLFLIMILLAGAAAAIYFFQKEILNFILKYL